MDDLINEINNLSIDTTETIKICMNLIRFVKRNSEHISKDEMIAILDTINNIAKIQLKDGTTINSLMSKVMDDEKT